MHTLQSAHSCLPCRNAVQSHCSINACCLVCARHRMPIQHLICSPALLDHCCTASVCTLNATAPCLQASCAAVITRCLADSAWFPLQAVCFPPPTICPLSMHSMAAGTGLHPLATVSWSSTSTAMAWHRTTQLWLRAGCSLTALHGVC